MLMTEPMRQVSLFHCAIRMWMEPVVANDSDGQFVGITDRLLSGHCSNDRDVIVFGEFSEFRPAYRSVHATASHD